MGTPLVESRRAAPGVRTTTLRRAVATVPAVVAPLGLAAVLAAQTPVYRPKAETLPAPVAPQPVAFSHRVHAGEAEIECLACHPGAVDEDFATLPPAATCMSCHAAVVPDSPEVARIAAAARDGKGIAWVPVYRVPDYVFFSHREHAVGGETCATCHGPVETRDVLEKEVSTGMNACLDCHRARGGPVHCAACHVLGH